MDKISLTYSFEIIVIKHLKIIQKEKYIHIYIYIHILN